MRVSPRVIKLIKDVYRRVLPISIRQSSLLVKLKNHLYWHDMIYDLDYYNSDVEDPAVRSARTISDSILTEFKPKHIVEVGCGTGALLEALRNRGCDVLGLDYSEAALMLCRARHLNVVKFDLERDILKDDRIFDVGISMEVAEHLPARVADRYVDLLTSLSKVIVFTAAPPGQGGSDHVNEQPPSYWISKFQQRGFEHSEGLSKRWRGRWQTAGDVASCYYRNLMVFRQTQQF
jgi:SAM-dependent methyltransferase